MKIIDETLLDQFRRKEACEWCKRQTRSGLDPHHYMAKGMGGGRRIDVAINLVSLCRACHDLAHRGLIARCELLKVIATREKMKPKDIKEALWKIIRTPRK